MLPGETLPFRMYNFSPIHTSWLLNKYIDFNEANGIYEIKLRALTASHQSQWAEQKVDMTPKGNRINLQSSAKVKLQSKGGYTCQNYCLKTPDI